MTVSAFDAKGAKEPIILVFPLQFRHTPREPDIADLHSLKSPVKSWIIPLWIRNQPGMSLAFS